MVTTFKLGQALLPGWQTGELLMIPQWSWRGIDRGGGSLLVGRG